MDIEDRDVHAVLLSIAQVVRWADLFAKRIQNMEAAIEHAAEVTTVPALVKRMEVAPRELRALERTLVGAQAPLPPRHELRDAMLRRVNDWRKVLLARHAPACRDVLQRLAVASS